MKQIIIFLLIKLNKITKIILTNKYSDKNDAGKIIEYYIIEDSQEDFYNIKVGEYDYANLLKTSLYNQILLLN